MICICKKCGAIVSGHYCSCCGAKIVTDLQDFRRHERREKTRFVKEGVSLSDRLLREACWEKSKEIIYKIPSATQIDSSLHPEAEFWLGETVRRSRKLYRIMLTVFNVPLNY